MRWNSTSQKRNGLHKERNWGDIVLTTEQIQKFIAVDAASPAKLDAKTGWRYYQGHHDIENRKIYFVNSQKKLQEDLLKSNIRISHPYHREVTDQVVQYILCGEERFIRSDDPELQAELDNRFNFNEDYIAELYKTLTGVVAKGWDYMYHHKNKDGITEFEHADSLGIVEVMAKETDDQCEYLIYYYDEMVLDKTITRIQVWDANQVWFYCRVNGGEIEPDESEKINPRPHTLHHKGEKVFTNENTRYGQIPFICMENFPLKRSDLFYYKDDIDDYDLHNCDLSNNLQDTNEAAYILSGFNGSKDDLDELMMNFRAKKAMGLPDEGSVEVPTVNVPYEARKVKMEIDKENIYHAGQGLNTEGLKDMTATTNLAIKSAYSSLDSKAVKLKISLKQFLRKLLKIVLPEINQAKKKDYQQKDIYFVFEPVLPTNELEKAQIELAKAQTKQTKINTLLTLQERLDNETVMQGICEELEIDYNEIKDKLPPPDDLAAYEAKLSGKVPEDAKAGVMSAEA